MAITLSFYLDSRAAKKQTSSDNAEYPVKLSITKDRKTAYIPTGILVQSNQWSAGKIVKRADKHKLNDFLDSFKSHIRNILYDARGFADLQSMTASEIKAYVSDILAGKDPLAPKQPLFMELFDAFAESRKSERTKEIYRVTGRKIRKIIPKADKLTADQITLDWLDFLNDELEDLGNNSTTRNLDFRNIRAVCRHARKHKYMRDDPFLDFEWPDILSPDRSLTVEQLRVLLFAKIENWEKKYLDFFLLSFLLRGINTEDLLHLEQIQNGRVDFRRKKTNTPMSVKIEPEAAEIIKKYPGQKYLLDILDRYSCTHNWTAKVDAALKQIALRNGLPAVTMYWARHTWATLAHADLGIDISTVGDALGHTPGKKVTHTYVHRRDYTRIDDANRMVIDYVFSSAV